MDDRLASQFEQSVQSTLEPVLSRFGFKRTESERLEVKFESASVLICLRYAPYSYEIDLEIVLKDKSDWRFSAYDLVAASQGTEEAFFQSSSVERVEFCVNKIAELVLKYGVDLLKGDSVAYGEMRRDSTRRSREHTEVVTNAPIRCAAEEAWRNKDYAKTKELYCSISNELSPVEASRLKYALKNLSDQREQA